MSESKHFWMYRVAMNRHFLNGSNPQENMKGLRKLSLKDLKKLAHETGHELKLKEKKQGGAQ